MMHPAVQNEAEGERETISELSLPDALALAMQIHRRGHLVEAETLYRKVLDAAPDYADAQHFLGVLLHQSGDSDAAIGLIHQSIALNPGEPNYYNNLGNVLVEAGRLAEASDAYVKVIALAPDHANAHNNLGALSKARGQFDEAAAAYQKAIELNPDHVDAHNNMGKLLSAQGRTKEAIAWYCKAITMRHNPDSRKLLGIAYYTLGQTEKAAEVYRQWLAEEPESPVARHMLSACSGENVPPRASDDYVESTFDRFADSFDAKLGKLAYRAPALIAEAVAGACAIPEKRLIALDAGCGTGLCGPLIAQYVHRLIGVDLSSGMLAKARGRNTYDELIKSELGAYLLTQPDAFNLIVSADTLVYFGSLEEVLGAAYGALQDDGLLIFTVEAAGDETADKAVDDAADKTADIGYRINPHGRYSHSSEYLRQVLSAVGFSVLSMEPAVLRMEGGNPVAGLVVTSRKANNSAIKDDKPLTAVQQ